MCGRRADTRAHFRVCESGKIYLGRGMRVSELGRPGRGHTVVSSRCVAAARLGRGAPQATKISHVAWRFSHNSMHSHRDRVAVKTLLLDAYTRACVGDDGHGARAGHSTPKRNVA